VRLKELEPLKKSNDLIGNRTRLNELCYGVPQFSVFGPGELFEYDT
jgi:hypothetical protein